MSLVDIKRHTKIRCGDVLVSKTSHVEYGQSIFSFGKEYVIKKIECSGAYILDNQEENHYLQRHELIKFFHLKSDAAFFNDYTKHKVLEWAEERKLLKFENRFKQYSKLQEESNELLIALLDENPVEIVDAIGDCVVVLTILANQVGFDIDECFNQAYETIKNRKGETINGTFIKE